MKKIKSPFKQLQRNKQPSLAILAVAIAGLSLFAISKAASFSISVEPENGTVSQNATRVSDPSASGGQAVTFGQATNTENIFSLIIVPDTQHETGYNPTKFTDRMQWIANNKATLNIKFVVQVGDLVDSDNCGSESIVFLDPGTNQRPQCNQTLRNQKVFYPVTSKSNHYQYKNADNGIRILDNAKIPYGLAIGNHDAAGVCGGPACVGGNSDWGVPAGTTTYSLQRTTTTFNSYFPASRVQNVDEKGFFEPNKVDNYYETFQGGGLQWLVINFELWPRAAAIDWAKTVVASHPHHNVIINTHNYLSSSGSIIANQGGYGDTGPQYMFDNLVKIYPNIRFVFSGHLPVTAKREDTGINGNKIYSFLDCYHDKNNNQTRIMKIDTKNNTIVTDTYNNPADPNTKRSDGSYNLTNVNWVR